MLTCVCVSKKKQLRTDRASDTAGLTGRRVEALGLLRRPRGSPRKSRASRCNGRTR